LRALSDRTSADDEDARIVMVRSVGYEVNSALYKIKPNGTGWLIEHRAMSDGR